VNVRARQGKEWKGKDNPTEVELKTMDGQKQKQNSSITHRQHYSQQQHRTAVKAKHPREQHSTAQLAESPMKLGLRMLRIGVGWAVNG